MSHLRVRALLPAESDVFEAKEKAPNPRASNKKQLLLRINGVSFAQSNQLWKWKVRLRPAPTHFGSWDLPNSSAERTAAPAKASQNLRTAGPSMELTVMRKIRNVRRHMLETGGCRYGRTPLGRNGVKNALTPVWDNDRVFGVNQRVS